MLEYDFDQSITFCVCMTSHAVEQAINDELARHGITYRQLQVLGWLAVEGGKVSQSQLAERMRIEAPTLAGILERMERNQWIKRESFPNDRRKKLVRPTPKVKPVWEKIVTAARQVRARATEGLSEQELASVRHVLETIQQNLATRKVAEEVV